MNNKTNNQETQVNFLFIACAAEVAQSPTQNPEKTSQAASSFASSLRPSLDGKSMSKFWVLHDCMLELDWFCAVGREKLSLVQLLLSENLLQTKSAEEARIVFSLGGEFDMDRGQSILPLYSAHG